MINEDVFLIYETYSIKKQEVTCRSPIFQIEIKNLLEFLLHKYPLSKKRCETPKSETFGSFCESIGSDNRSIFAKR